MKLRRVCKAPKGHIPSHQSVNIAIISRKIIAPQIMPQISNMPLTAEIMILLTIPIGHMRQNTGYPKVHETKNKVIKLIKHARIDECSLLLAFLFVKRMSMPIGHNQPQNTLPKTIISINVMAKPINIE